MKVAKAREAGAILGREGLAKRALEIAEEIVKDGSYKRAIKGAGELSVIAAACGFDDYWEEKANSGLYSERHKMEYVLEDKQ
jgi:hypothetical protein